MSRKCYVADTDSAIYVEYDGLPEVRILAIMEVKRWGYSADEDRGSLVATALAKGKCRAYRVVYEPSDDFAESGAMKRFYVAELHPVKRDIGEMNEDAYCGFIERVRGWQTKRKTRCAT